jgi:hypothetical protein
MQGWVRLAVVNQEPEVRVLKLRGGTVGSHGFGTRSFQELYFDRLFLWFLPFAPSLS